MLMFKRFSSIALMLMIAMVVTACSDAASPTPNLADDTNETSDTTENTSDMADDSTPEFVINITGTEQQTIEESGNLFCVNQGSADAVNQLDISGGVITTGYLTLMIPADTIPGTYEFVGAGDDLNLTGEAITVSFNGENDSYRNGTGEVVIETIPQAEGEMFVGTVTGELGNGDGETITMDATLNVDAGMQSFDEC